MSRVLRRTRLSIRLALGMALLLAAVSAAPAHAGTYVFQPDGRIRKLGGALVGNNIYNDTATGQTLGAVKAVGESQRFIVTLQNDGDTPDYFSISIDVIANGGSWTVTTLHGWPGTPLDSPTPTIEPGGVYQFRFMVRPTAGAAGNWLSVKFTATSQFDGSKRDAVAGRVVIK